MAVGKILWATTNLYKKNLQIIIQNKKNSSKQALPTTYTLVKMFFVATTFEALWDVSFQTEWKKTGL